MGEDLCNILEKNSLSSNEMKLEGIIYALSILAEFAVEKLPTILTEQVNYLQSQLNDINSKINEMQRYNVPANPLAPNNNMFPQIPGVMNPPASFQPPGNYSPKPASKPPEPMNMQDELKQILAKRKKYE